MLVRPYAWVLSLLVVGQRFQLSHAYRILSLFINGHKSHLLLYSSVVNTLLDRGHNVTVITSGDMPGLHSEGANCHWMRLSAKYTDPLVTTSQGRLAKVESMLKRIETTASFMEDPQWQRFMEADNQFDLLLIGYLFNDYQLGVASHFSCPVAVIWTGQPIGFVLSLIGNSAMKWYVPQPCDRHQYKGFRAWLLGCVEEIVEYFALYKMKEIYDLYFPPPRYPTFWEARKNVSMVLCNHHSLSEGPIAAYIPGIVEIGGVEYQPKKHNHAADQLLEVDNILKRCRRIIYLSFGSRVKWSLLEPSIERTFVKAFQAFPKHTVLWTYDKNCSVLQHEAPTVFCRQWWPQPFILNSNYTELFISHGGKGSISEAFRYGKQVLGLPLFGDQRANVAKLQSRRLGLKLDIYNLTAEDLVAALNELLHHDEYRNNMLRFSHLYQDRSVASHASTFFWLEYIVRHNGARHLRSPALDLNFIEYNNIDLHILIYTILVVAVKLCNVLEENLLRDGSGRKNH